MASFFESELSKSLLVLAMAGTLAACGGSDSNSDNDNDDHSDEEHHDDEHAHTGGRLIYSVSDDSGLNMYDQTAEEADAFSTDVVTTSATGATLVLAKSGLTAAMLDNGAVSIVDSGLEHLAEEDGHTHEVSSEATTLTSGITMVVATHEYFSAFDGMASTVIDAEDGTAVTAPSSDAYPTLALTGGHFLTFTNGIDGAIDLEVVEANGDSLETPVTLSCASGGITTSAQTEHLTQVLCGNDTLLTLIAEEGETETEFYTDSDAEAGFDSLTATFSENDVIAAWNSTTGAITLTNAHGDHPHSTDVTENVDAESILAVTPVGDHDTEVLGVLAGDGVFTALFYTVEDESVTVESKDTFIINSEATWTSADKLLAGATAFLAVNTEANELYYMDAHDGSDYHVHGSAIANEDLASVSSAVFAFAGGEHEHEDEEGEEHDHEE
ncbi:hypothetical protein SAMN05421686_105176 [Thalassolituus maritimus]|uniref:Uncharacterized protein n=1 Tax=Thalassolituus maritimus TaxID=484498 RepID=A0A1N7MGP1_9GAMM|nr:hypothetical protein [Thalassolituus maritimus]SIS85316.1 hypothetical protein SAMN05421686_105176 [Thalassolituus maritimus]